MDEWAENDDEWRDMLEEGDFMEVDLEPGTDTSTSDDSDEESDLDWSLLSRIELNKIITKAKTSPQIAVQGINQVSVVSLVCITGPEVNYSCLKWKIIQSLLFVLLSISLF